MLTKKKNIRTGKTLWQSLPYPEPVATPLARDAKTEVLIIGAGVTGAMAAEALSEAGFRVMLIDRRGPLLGATSATTALLQYEIDTPLSLLKEQIGKAKAERAWRRSKLALESLAAKIQALNIDCGVKRKRSLYLAGNVLDPAGLAQEAEARAAAGLFSTYLSKNALQEQYGIARKAALVSYDNLTVNPLCMAAGFLQRALAQKAVLHAPVIAEAIEATEEGVTVQTQAGPSIRANQVIYATGYELPKAIHTRRHSIHSTYAIATKRQKAKLWSHEALIWEAADPYLYLRTTDDGRVICGGEDEEFESAEARDALMAKKTRRLEQQLQKLFPQLDSRAEFAWCGSFGASNTGLPSIGAIPGLPNCYAILAYGGNGITFSRIAAELLRTKLTGGHDPDEDLFTF